MTRPNSIAIFLLAMTLSELCGQIPSPQIETEREARIRLARRKAYITRPRTAHPGKPQTEDLKSLFSALEKLGFTSWHGTRDLRSGSGNGGLLRDLMIVRSRTTQRGEESWSYYDEIQVHAETDFERSENSFLGAIGMTPLPGTPGSYDGRGVGENSAYWLNTRHLRIDFYRDNFYVRVSCHMPQTELSSGLSAVEKAKLNASGRRDRVDQQVYSSCVDLALWLDSELQRPPVSAIR